MTVVVFVVVVVVEMRFGRLVAGSLWVDVAFREVVGWWLIRCIAVGVGSYPEVLDRRRIRKGWSSCDSPLGRKRLIFCM